MKKILLIIVLLLSVLVSYGQVNKQYRGSNSQVIAVKRDTIIPIYPASRNFNIASDKDTSTITNPIVGNIAYIDSTIFYLYDSTK